MSLLILNSSVSLLKFNGLLKDSFLPIRLFLGQSVALNEFFACNYLLALKQRL